METTKKVSQYRTNVLDVNKAFKQDLTTTNKAIKLLIHSDALTKAQSIFFKGVLKDDEAYKKFDTLVRRNKKGLISVFEILKAYHKLVKDTTK